MIAEIVYQKYRHGDSINDDDVLRGLEVYLSAQAALRGFGPVFRLSIEEIDRVVVWLTDIRAVRRL